MCFFKVLRSLFLNKKCAVSILLSYTWYRVVNISRRKQCHAFFLATTIKLEFWDQLYSEYQLETIYPWVISKGTIDSWIMFAVYITYSITSWSEIYVVSLHLFHQYKLLSMQQKVWAVWSRGSLCQTRSGGMDSEEERPLPVT